MKNYDEMAENVFRKRDEHILRKKAQRKKIVKAYVSVACVVMVLLAGFGVWQNGRFENKPLNSTEVNEQRTDNTKEKENQTIADSTVSGERDYYGSVTDTPYINGVCIPLNGEWNCNGENLKIIESYEGSISSALACYALPKNGDQFFSIPLHTAFDAYGETDEDTGKKIVYRVVVRVFEDGKMITGKENLVEIAQKFSEMGYYVPVEIPNNRNDLAVLTLHASEEDLKNFPEDKDNGYFFFLYNEADGKYMLGNGVTEE